MVIVNSPLEARSRKTALALSEIADVTILDFFRSSKRESWEGQPFKLRYGDPIGIGGSEHRIWVLKVGFNLTIYPILKKLFSKRVGVFGENVVYRTLMEECPDAIISVNANTLKPCGRAAEDLGAALIYDAYEYWPEHRLESAVALTDIERAVIDEVERAYMEDADVTITVSPELAHEYQKLYGLTRTPIVTYNIPLDHVDKARLVNTPPRFIFIGNFQIARNIEMIFKAAAVTDGIDMTFQGSGVLGSWLETQIKDHKVSDRIQVNDPVPYEQLIESASFFDIGIIAHEAYNMQIDGSLPNKFFEYLSAGLALIVPPTTAFKNFPGIEEFAYILEDTSVDAVSRAIESLASDPTRITAMKKAAIEVAHQYNYENHARVIQDAFLDMMDERSSRADELQEAR